MIYNPNEQKTNKQKRKKKKKKAKMHTHTHITLVEHFMESQVINRNALAWKCLFSLRFMNADMLGRLLMLLMK